MGCPLEHAGYDFYSFILFVQITPTCLLDYISYNFWNFLLSAGYLLFIVAILLYVFLLSLFHPAESILRCKETSMDVTGPIRLLAPLCPVRAQAVEDHTSGSRNYFVSPKRKEKSINFYMKGRPVVYKLYEAGSLEHYFIIPCPDICRMLCLTSSNMEDWELN